MDWLVLLPRHCIVPAILLLGLQAETSAMPISHIIPSSSLYCPAFLLGQPIQHFEAHFILWASLVRFIPEASLAHFILQTSSTHFIPWASLAHFIFFYLLHSHRFLLNPLNFLSLMTTSFAFGFIGF